MSALRHTHHFRIRYAETDQMGTYFNAHALNWFEVGRTELARAHGLPYAEWEARGVFLPVVEASLRFHASAPYDTPLAITTSASLHGRARLRFEADIRHAELGHAVVSGHTLHALLDPCGKLIRPPQWVLHFLGTNV